MNYSPGKSENPFNPTASQHFPQNKDHYSEERFRFGLIMTLSYNVQLTRFPTTVRFFSEYWFTHCLFPTSPLPGASLVEILQEMMAQKGEIPPGAKNTGATGEEKEAKGKRKK